MTRMKRDICTIAPDIPGVTFNNSHKGAMVMFHANMKGKLTTMTLRRRGVDLILENGILWAMCDCILVCALAGVEGRRVTEAVVLVGEPIGKGKDFGQRCAGGDWGERRSW